MQTFWCEIDVIWTIFGFPSYMVSYFKIVSSCFVVIDNNDNTLYMLLMGQEIEWEWNKYNKKIQILYFSA